VSRCILSEFVGLSMSKSALVSESTPWSKSASVSLRNAYLVGNHRGLDTNGRHQWTATSDVLNKIPSLTTETASIFRITFKWA